MAAEQKVPSSASLGIGGSTVSCSAEGGETTFCRRNLPVFTLQSAQYWTESIFEGIKRVSQILKKRGGKGERGHHCKDKSLLQQAEKNQTPETCTTLCFSSFWHGCLLWLSSQVRLWFLFSRFHPSVFLSHWWDMDSYGGVVFCSLQQCVEQWSNHKLWHFSTFIST